MSEMIPNRGFNITLEILQGCKYSCAGCMVDKDFDPGPFDTDGPDLLALVDEMQAGGYELTEFTVGPVDVIASKVGVAILDHPLVRGLARRYQGMVMPLALLQETGLKELCGKLNDLLKGKHLKIATPFPVNSIHNTKHIDLIRDRVKFIIEHTPDVKFELLYLTVNMVDGAADHLDVQADREIHALDFGVRKLVEYVFPHARRGFGDILNRQAFLRAFGSFCETIRENRSRYLIKPLNDSLEFTYRAGELYYTPTLIEKFPLFADRYVLSRPWSRQGAEGLEEGLYIQELTQRIEHPECGDCMHIDRCARGDIHLIMSHLRHEECLISMKNDWSMPL